MVNIATSIMHLASSTSFNMAMSIIILIAASLFFFFLFHHIVPKATQEGSAAHLPPGPTPWPILGSLLSILRHKPHFRWVLSVAEGKDITCIRLGGVHVIVVNSSELGREFLKRHDAVFASRPITMATKYSSRGFLTVAFTPWGEQWKKMRRVVASEVMNTKRLRWQANLCAEEADHLTKYIYKQCCSASGRVINIRPALRYYSGNIIRRMLFGVRHFGKGGEHGGSGKEEIEHVEAAFTVLSLVYAFCPSDFIPWLKCLDLDGHERIMKEAVKVIYKYQDHIVDERLEKWKRGKEEVGIRDDSLEDILDVLISLRDDNKKPLLTGEEIKAQLAELVYATVDNPSNMVEWALAELLNRPDTLQKAVEELDRVVGKERLVQEGDFENLPYLKACAREALRLHPATSFNVPHVALSDAVVAGYFIPKGSQVLLSRVGLGRNPKTWPDPLRFDPDRHLKGGKAAELVERDLKFISFSTGRRGCVGAFLGTSMTYMLLGRLLQAFEWSLPLGVSRVDLSEEKKSLFMARPLHACGQPRLQLLADL